jgi:hypothetical protein
MGQGFSPAEGDVSVSVVGQGSVSVVEQGFSPAERGTSLDSALQFRTRAEAQSEGTLVHALLEHAVRHPDVTTDGLTRLAT